VLKHEGTILAGKVPASEVVLKLQASCWLALPPPRCGWPRLSEKSRSSVGWLPG